MMLGLSSSTWLAVLALASLSIVSTVVGVTLARRTGDRPVLRAAGLGFSVGVMVTIAVAELIPQATSEIGGAATAVAVSVGIGVLAVLHLTIPHIHLVVENRGERSRSLDAAYLVVIGMVLHDVPEGFAMANAYVSTPQLGVLVAVAIMLHNIPEEFAMAVPAVATGRRRFVIRAAIISAIAEPLGAVIGLVGVSVVPESNAALLAFAAGAMLFVSIHELLPMARQLGHLPARAVGIATGAATWALLQAIVLL